MDDVLRSGLTLSQGINHQMDVEKRGDCVLERPNPLRSTASRGYEVEGIGGGGGMEQSSFDHGNSIGNGGSFNGIHYRDGGGGHDASVSMVEQSAEEALNSLVEEMKEILGAPVYAQTPLQSVSEKFWLALGEAMRSNTRKEEKLEQALAKIKADFLLAREVSF